MKLLALNASHRGERGITARLLLRLGEGAQQAGAIRYAASKASGSGDCSSWANACTLETALSNAGAGDQIWVRAGVHYPGSAGNRSATFTLKSGVQVYGGFNGTESTLNQRNWRGNLTILSGDIDKNDNHGGDDINENASQIVGNNAYHVVTGGGTNSSAVLDGFVITAGRANGSFPDNSGGGIFNQSSSPTLRNLTFSGNAAMGGGGMYNELGSSTLTDIIFSGNAADYAGGMYNNYSSPTLTNVTFSGNTAIFNGGGMYNEINSNPQLTNVTFSGNSATFGGGGMYNSGSNPTLTNVIIWGSSSGGSIVNVVSNPTISYSNIQGGYPGTGNIAADPQFVDADGADNTVGTLDDNLRLQLTSPAIDAGNNNAPGLSGITTDLDGKERFEDVPTVPNTGNGTPPIVDMGAYEARLIKVFLPLIAR